MKKTRPYKQGKIRNFSSQLASRYLASSSEAGPQHAMMVTWGNKCHSHECPQFLLLFPGFYCWPQRHMVRNIPVVSLGQLSWLFPLPTSCSPPACSLAGAEWKKEKSSIMCKHCSAIGKILVCCQHCFSHNYKTQWHINSCEENQLHSNQTQSAANDFRECKLVNCFGSQ